MTTYTTIPGTDIDTDSPITESLMTKLRDNPIAITEGATGAPTIQTAGIANQAVSSAKIADDAVDFASKINDTVGAGQLNVDNSASQFVPKGVCNLVCSTGSALLQFFVNGAWYNHSVGINTTTPQQVVSDGVNVRVTGFTGTHRVEYRCIFQ